MAVIHFDEDVEGVASDLERAAQMLRAGEIDSVFFVCVDEDGTAPMGWLIQENASWLLLLGHVELHVGRLKATARKLFDEGEDED